VGVRLASAEQARRAVSALLKARRNEIEQTILVRVESVSDDTKPGDPEYAEEMRQAVSTALDFGLAAIEHSEASAPPIPAQLLIRARLAARDGVELAAVLRRYFAGYTLLSEYLAEEAEKHGAIEGAALRGVQRTQAALFDRLVAAVTEEYSRERKRPASAEQRRAELVKALLAGESLDTPELAYDFDVFHVAVITRGIGAAEVVRGLGAALGCRVLLIRRDGGAVWAWLGARDGPDLEQLEQLVSARWPANVPLAIGEPGKGRSGWQRSHQQAKAAFLVANRKPGVLVRYSDVALPASMLQDDLLATSLHEIYLAPLERTRGAGSALRQTLRAYFAAGRNGASAAAALQVSRQTIGNRLQEVEDQLGRPLASCVAELEAAIRLEELDQPALNQLSNPLALDNVKDNQPPFAT
jgi:hypothetical protein